MEKRNIGIIATVATTLLCACPGLCFFLFGSIFTLAGSVDPNAYEFATEGDIFTIGVVFLGVGIFMIAIPIVIGVIVFWPRAKAKINNINEPVPPPL